MTGLLTTGAPGVWRTVTLTDTEDAEQPLIDTVKLYVPLAADVALLIDGLCTLLVNPFGPLQLYEAPDVFELPVKFSV